MKVALMGPDDLGAFFLVDGDGNDCQIVARWDEHPGAAWLFGWKACHCGQTDGTRDCDHKTHDQMIEEAREFLIEHIGDEIEDPGFLK